MDKIDLTPKSQEEFLTMVEMHNLYHSHESATATNPNNNRQHCYCRVCRMPLEDSKKGKETISRKGNTAVWDDATRIDGFGNAAGEWNPVWLIAWYIKAREFNMFEALLRSKGEVFKSCRCADELREAVTRWFNPVLAMRERFKSQAYARAAFIYAKHVAADDEMRKCASTDPEWALEYATKLDGGTPHNVTRDGACRYMETAMAYSLAVDKGYHPSTLSKALEYSQESFKYLGHHWAGGKNTDMNSIIKARWVRDAATAFKYAMTAGPEDDTRALVHASKDAQFILDYAMEVDKGPRDDARQCVIDTGDTKAIIKYAGAVDKCGRDDTRAASLSDAAIALSYARNIDKVPRDDTRTASCVVSACALNYALHVDGQPCDETRIAASKDSSLALDYAQQVDRKPHPVTRAAVCCHSGHALDYSVYVDQAVHPFTRLAVCSNAIHALSYARQHNEPYEATRMAACTNPECALEYATDVDKEPRNDTRLAASFDARAKYRYEVFQDKYYKEFVGELFAGLEVNKEEVVTQ